MKVYAVKSGSRVAAINEIGEPVALFFTRLCAPADATAAAVARCAECEIGDVEIVHPGDARLSDSLKHSRYVGPEWMTGRVMP